MDSYEKSLLKGVAFVFLSGFFVLGFIFLLYSCFSPSKEETARDHAMQVVQEMDGCKVYRFYDGNYHYITRCGANVVTRKNWDENCGKACIQHRTEDITTEGNQ